MLQYFDQIKFNKALLLLCNKINGLYYIVSNNFYFYPKTNFIFTAFVILMETLIATNNFLCHQS